MSDSIWQWVVDNYRALSIFGAAGALGGVSKSITSLALRVDSEGHIKISPAGALLLLVIDVIGGSIAGVFAYLMLADSGYGIPYMLAGAVIAGSTASSLMAGAQSITALTSMQRSVTR